MNKNDEIMKLLENEYNLNNEKIKELDFKIRLLNLLKNENKLRIISTIGISIFISLFFTLINKSGVITYEVSGLTCLISSCSLGLIINKIEMNKYKSKLKKISNSKNNKELKEELIRYSIEKNKINNKNEILKKIYNDIKEENIFFPNKLDIRDEEEIENDIMLQNLSESLKQEKLDIIISQKTLNNFNYNKIEDYIGKTLLSLVGVFSICYLPNLNNLSFDVIKYFINVSLIVNIPLNLLLIKNIIEDKSINVKINKELEYDFNGIELDYKKIVNELIAVKKELLNNYYILSSKKTNEDEYINNNNFENKEEKNKVLILKK